MLRQKLDLWKQNIAKQTKINQTKEDKNLITSQRNYKSIECFKKITVPRGYGNEIENKNFIISQRFDLIE